MHDFERGPYEIDLPDKVTILPRQKQLPDKRKETKWEHFAKLKGI